MVERRRFSITNLFRRQTPKPADRQIYSMGIQEREHRHMMTGPLLYNIINQSVIGRTCITQLKQEIFRRGYVWEKAYEAKCKIVERNTKDLCKNVKDAGIQN